MTSSGSPAGTNTTKGDLIKAVTAIHADRDRATADNTPRRDGLSGPYARAEGQAERNPGVGRWPPSWSSSSL